MASIIKRIFLAGGMFMLTALHLPTASGGNSSASYINIWKGTGCRKEVRLIPYMAEGDGNIGCIVCPGGSYFWHDRKAEAKDVAEWLNRNNISAFVLEYRVGGVFSFIFHDRYLFRGNRYPDMLMDLQRSIQILREGSEEYHINPAKLGVLGFSAGGHLAGMGALFFDTPLLEEVGITHGVSLRPAFVGSIYPVVSFVDSSVHKRSMRGIMGEKSTQTPEMKDSLSLELHVRKDMPPMYLMNCKDDPVVDWRNAVLLRDAMASKGVEYRYVQYNTGGHGFGADPRKTTVEAASWTADFIEWLRKIFKE